MASRKKAPADMRTIDIFTGKTKLEEVEDMLVEEDEFAKPANDAPKDRSDPTFEQEETAIRWLGLDGFNVGDDCRVALNGKGAVLMLIDAAPDGSVRAQREQKLSRKQWTKLCHIIEHRGER